MALKIILEAKKVQASEAMDLRKPPQDLLQVPVFLIQVQIEVFTLQVASKAWMSLA